MDTKQSQISNKALCVISLILSFIAISLCLLWYTKVAPGVNALDSLFDERQMPLILSIGPLISIVLSVIAVGLSVTGLVKKLNFKTFSKVNLILAPSLAFLIIILCYMSLIVFVKDLVK